MPEFLDDWVDEGNPVGVVDVFVDALGCATSGSMVSTCSDLPAGERSFADAQALHYGDLTASTRAGGWSAAAAISR